MKKFIRRIGAVAPSNWLRCLILRVGGIKIGRSTYIGWGTKISGEVSIGSFVRIEQQCVIGSSVKIGDYTKIGRNAYIGPDVELGQKVIISSNTGIANSTIGDCSFIESGVQFTGFQKGKITIGEHSYIGIHNVLDWSGGIEIGNYVHIAGPSVGIWTHSSVYQALSGDKIDDHHRKQVAPVKIEDYVYIGGSSTVYPGVKINHHSVVLPNTAVNKDVGEYTMVGGSPMSVRRKIEIREDEIKFQSSNIHMVRKSGNT